MTRRAPDSYDDDASFRCSQGCGTYQRQHCLERYGYLTCPRCKGRGTLSYVPSHEGKLAPIANPKETHREQRTP